MGDKITHEISSVSLMKAAALVLTIWAIYELFNVIEILLIYQNIFQMVKCQCFFRMAKKINQKQNFQFF